MDGENHGKPYFLMDDLGGKTTIFGNLHISIYHIHQPESLAEMVPLPQLFQGK